MACQHSRARSTEVRSTALQSLPLVYETRSAVWTKNSYVPNLICDHMELCFHLVMLVTVHPRSAHRHARRYDSYVTV